MRPLSHKVTLIVLFVTGCTIIYPINSIFAQNVTGTSPDNISSYLNSPLSQFESPDLGFKIKYPSNCQKVEVGPFVGFCGWETGGRVGKLGNYASLEELTKEVTLPNEQVGSKVSVTPFILQQGSPANKIEISYDTTGGRIGVVTLVNGNGYTMGTDFGPGGKESAQLLLERMIETFEIIR